jgi:hypothetical protein
MSVKETSVNKDDFSMPWKNEVWLAGKAGSMQPESVSASMDDTPDHEFRLRVFAPDKRHALAALGLGQRVHRLP